MRKQVKIIMLIVLVMIIGFASVATLLNFNGTLSMEVQEQDFDVYFSTVFLNGVEHKELISSDGRAIHFDAISFSKINEEVLLSYEITNSSHVYDAYIDMNVDFNNEYVEIRKKNYFKDNLIQPQKSEKGELVFTLVKGVVEDKTIEINIDLKPEAREKEKSEVPSINDDTFSFAGFLVDKDNHPLKEKSIVIFSENPHYLTTDLAGYFYVDNMEQGTHEIYYFNDMDISSLEGKRKDELEMLEHQKQVFTTSTNTIQFDNGMFVQNFMIDKTVNFDLIKINVGDEHFVRIADKSKPVEFFIETNENKIFIDDEEKDLRFGDNLYEIINKEKEKINVLVHNVKPIAPIITGGNDVFVKDEVKIKIEKAGIALSGVKNYEYSVNQQAMDINSTLEVSGTSNDVVTLNEEGTYYIYYRTVSNHNIFSEWSNSQVVKIDRTNPILEIGSVTSTTNTINISFEANDRFSGIKNSICYYGKDSYEHEGSIKNQVCTFNELESATTYQYMICVEDNAFNDNVCKTGEYVTKSIINPSIKFETVPFSGEYNKQQSAIVTFDSRGIKSPKFFIKSTRKGNSDIAVSVSCGSGVKPDNCTSISNTTQINENVWYEVGSAITIDYHDGYDELSQIIALTFDGYNYSGESTGTISKIAYNALDIEYSNSLNSNIHNVQEAIDDLYKKIR